MPQALLYVSIALACDEILMGDRSPHVLIHETRDKISHTSPAHQGTVASRLAEHRMQPACAVAKRAQAHTHCAAPRIQSLWQILALQKPLRAADFQLATPSAPA